MLNLEEYFPFPLDDFQLEAIRAINSGNSVVLTAPTGSGKTLIGEFAIYRGLSHDSRVFYTNSPINVLPEPVGAVKTTEFPLLIARIASNWKSSSGKGKYSSKLSNNCD